MDYNWVRLDDFSPSPTELMAKEAADRWLKGRLREGNQFPLPTEPKLSVVCNKWLEAFGFLGEKIRGVEGAIVHQTVLGDKALLWRVMYVGSKVERLEGDEWVRSSPQRALVQEAVYEL